MATSLAWRGGGSVGNSELLVTMPHTRGWRLSDGQMKRDRETLSGERLNDEDLFKLFTASKFMGYGAQPPTAATKLLTPGRATGPRKVLGKSGSASQPTLPQR